MKSTDVKSTGVISSDLAAGGAATGGRVSESTAPGQAGARPGSVIGALPGAVAAEWIKFWSVRSSWLGLAGGTLLVVLLTAVNGLSAATNLHHSAPPAGTVLPVQEAIAPALLYGVFVFLTVAMMAVTSEYSSGSIRSTLQAVPRRGVMFAAKAVVVAVVLYVTGAATILIAAAVTYPLIAGEEFGGYGVWQSGEVASAALLGGVWVATLGLITLGLGAALRSAVGTLSTTFLLLAALPLILIMMGNNAASQVAARTPLMAGVGLLGRLDGLMGPGLVYGRWEALGWLLAWTIAALALGYIVLRRRDA